MESVDVTVVRTESNGYALGITETADGWVVYRRFSNDGAWTKFPDVAIFATEDMARSWINWQTIIPTRIRNV